MSAEVRMELMIQLRRRGWTYERIGRRVGMSPNGVMQAIRRKTSPETYYPKLDEEVDVDLPEEEEW
jgi:hypothetical protein